MYITFLLKREKEEIYDSRKLV